MSTLKHESGTTKIQIDFASEEFLSHQFELEFVELRVIFYNYFAMGKQMEQQIGFASGIFLHFVFHLEYTEVIKILGVAFVGDIKSK